MKTLFTTGMKESDTKVIPYQVPPNSMTENVLKTVGRALMRIKTMALKLSPFPTIDITKLEQSTAESEANFEKARTEFHAMMDFVELAMTMIHDSGVYLWYKDLSGRYKFASRAMVSRVLLPQTAAVCDNADVARLVLGKTDQELAAEYKDSHHGRSTFLKTLSIADEHTRSLSRKMSLFSHSNFCSGSPLQPVRQGSR